MLYKVRTRWRRNAIKLEVFYSRKISWIHFSYVIFAGLQLSNSPWHTCFKLDVVDNNFNQLSLPWRKPSWSPYLISFNVPSSSIWHLNSQTISQLQPCRLLKTSWYCWTASGTLLNGLWRWSIDCTPEFDDFLILVCYSTSNYEKRMLLVWLSQLSLCCVS